MKSLFSPIVELLLRQGLIIWAFTDSCFHCLPQRRIAALVTTALSYTSSQILELCNINQLLFTCKMTRFHTSGS